MIATSSPAKAEIPPTTGIWRETETGLRMSEDHETQLIKSLQRITGLENLAFDESGALRPGENSCSATGSKQARELLLKALTSGKVFMIEDHSSSPTVNFGQLDEGMNYEDLNRGRKFHIWRIRLDFDDFREMEAPREVRESFDAGFTLLHEILHGLGYQDASHEDEVGECEEMVNEARAELGLPLRDQYFGEALQMNSQIISVRVRFRSPPKSFNLDGKSPVETRARDRLQYLFFLLPIGQSFCQTLSGAAALECGPRR